MKAILLSFIRFCLHLFAEAELVIALAFALQPPVRAAILSAAQTR
jgi:hypothetical protein